MQTECDPAPHDPGSVAGRTDEAARMSRRYLAAERAGGLALGLAVVAVVALVCAYWALTPRFKDEQWQADQLPGRVLSLDTGGSEDSSGHAHVRYGLDSDHMRRATIAVGDVNRWYRGERVTVLVDPSTGSVTLPGENFTPEWFDGLAAGVVLGATVLGVLGCWVLVRVRGIGRALSRTQWGVVEVRSGLAPIGRSPALRRVLYVPDVSPHLVWAPRLPLRIDRTVALLLGSAPTSAEVAGDERGIVVRPSGSRRLVHASPHPWPATVA